jgi:hypothetical protein
MKAWFAIACCCLLILAHAGCHAPQFAAKVKGATEISGGELHVALLQGKRPVSAGIVWLRTKLPRAPGAADSNDDDAYFGNVFAAACTRAREGELGELGQVLAGIPKGHAYFLQCFSFYATARLRLQVAQLKRKPIRVEFPPTKAQPPAAFAAWPPELRDAWTAWHTAAAPYDELMEATAKAAEAAKAAPVDLETTLRTFLPKPAPGAWRELAKGNKELAGFCGMGMESFYHPRSRGLLLSLLSEEERIPAALGAALHQFPSYSMGDGPAPLGTLVAEFLTACGLDWELVFLGSLLPDEAENLQGIAQRLFERSFNEAAPWETLGALGSPRGVRAGFALIRETKMEPTEALSFLLLALGPDPDAGPVQFIMGNASPARRKALPAGVRAEALTILTTYLAAERPVEELQNALEAIPERLARPLRTPLETLVRHQNHVIAAKARELLAGARLISATTAIAPPPPPFHLRVLLDGKPVANTALTVQFDGNANDLQTDGEGRATVSLETVLEPAKIDRLRVEVFPRPTPGESLTTPATSSIPGLDPPAAKTAEDKPSPDSWPGPLLDVSVPVKAGETKEYEFAATTADLEITLDPRSAVAPKERARVFLVRENPAHSEARQIELSVAPGETATFHRLQLDRYTITVSAENAVTCTLPKVLLGKAGSMRLVKLEPGRKVKGRLFFPDGKSAGSGAYGVISRGQQAIAGIMLNDQPCDLMALGKYNLHVYSTAEIEAAGGAQGVVLEVTSDPRHGGLDYEFELTADSPPIVDLGELRLAPEKIASPAAEPVSPPAPAQ